MNVSRLINKMFDSGNLSDRIVNDFIRTHRPTPETTDICWLIARGDIYSAERLALEEPRGIPTLVLASIIQTSPTLLVKCIEDILPRASYLAECYSGETLTIRDVGCSVVTEDTVNAILSEYLCGHRNILPADEAGIQRMVVRAIFHGFGHRQDNPNTGLLTNGGANPASITRLQLSLKVRAIHSIHIRVLAALELTGVEWSDTDVSATSRRMVNIIEKEESEPVIQSAELVFNTMLFWKRFRSWRRAPIHASSMLVQ
jgi:hypothetical protein